MDCSPNLQPAETVTEEDKIMTEIAILGIDITKNVSQLHGANQAVRCIYRRRVMRD